MRPVFKIFGETIIFSYVASASIKIDDQGWQNDICQTDTWVHTTSGWKLVSTAAFLQPANPSAQKPDSSIVKTVVGEYQLNKDYACMIYKERVSYTANEQVAMKSSSLVKVTTSS